MAFPLITRGRQRVCHVRHRMRLVRAAAKRHSHIPGCVERPVRGDVRVFHFLSGSLVLRDVREESLAQRPRRLSFNSHSKSKTQAYQHANCRVRGQIRRRNERSRVIAR